MDMIGGFMAIADACKVDGSESCAVLSIRLAAIRHIVAQVLGLIEIDGDLLTAEQYAERLRDARLLPMGAEGGVA